MRILIDATPLLIRSAGIKNYLYYWIGNLQAAKSRHRIDAFPWLSLPAALDHDHSPLGFTGTASRLGYVVASNLIPAVPLLDWAARGAAVFHVSNQLRTPVRKTPVTATLYDLTCRLKPELHTAANVQADAAFTENVLKRARGLIAISESTRRDAVRLLGLREERIEVIYPGVPGGFYSVTAEDRSRVARRYKLSKPYVLFVGTIEPRKNLDLLLNAYLSTDADVRAEYDLVIAGPAGWAKPETTARLSSPPAGVRVLGYLPETDLPGITAAAAVVAYPSLYEGFGFPVAQAMAAGVPCVTSSVSSLPEVAGDGALLVDPNSESEIRAALESLLRSPSLRARLGANGARRAEMFRWENAVERSLAFFERVAGNC